MRIFDVEKQELVHRSSYQRLLKGIKVRYEKDKNFDDSYRILAGLVDWIGLIVSLLLAAARPRPPLLLPRRVVGVRVRRVVRRRVARPVTRVTWGRWCLVRPFRQPKVFELL